jgi:predicted DNA repair protein MutK
MGRALVGGMPVFLQLLSITGTAAMIWVGGGIIVHGLETYGLTSLGHAIDAAGEAAGRALPILPGAAEWVVAAAGAGLVGLLIGAALIPATQFVFAPAWKLVKSALPVREPVT